MVKHSRTISAVDVTTGATLRQRRVGRAVVTKFRSVDFSYAYLQLHLRCTRNRRSQHVHDFETGGFNNALNLFVFNRQINTAGMLRMLRTEGAFRELAEPNLIAMNGQEASFLAGGEFPVPVLQNSGSSGGIGITIVWKEYGIRLNFKPTIIDEEHIRLELAPEVSSIDFQNGVKFNGFVIPALRTRRAKTGVELRDGQSFALAGLLDNNETRSFSKIPIISEIPVLGNLFKSKSFQKQETELMFFVTAHMVKPVNPDDLPTMRGMDGLKNGSPLGIEPKTEGIQGQTGYKISGQGTETPNTPSVEAPKTTAPAKSTDQKTKTSTESGTTSSTGTGEVSQVRDPHPSLPVAQSVRRMFVPDSVKP